MMDILDKPKLLLEQKLLDQDASVYDWDVVTKHYVDISNLMLLDITYDESISVIIPLSWWKNGFEFFWIPWLPLNINHLTIYVQIYL